METKRIVDKIIQIENERRDLDLYQNRVEEIFGLITDEEFRVFLENNVEFLADIMSQYGYLDELVLNLFVFINKSTCFKNSIDRETCQLLASILKEDGYVTHERVMFYVDGCLDRVKRNLGYEINLDSEVAFLVNHRKTVYYNYL